MEDQDRDHISSRSNFSGRSDQELDEMLDELRAGKIGINQPGQNSSEHDSEDTPEENDNASGTGNAAKSKKGKSRKEGFNLRDEVISWIQVLVAAAIIAFCVNHFIIANSEVPTSSMETTIMAGDRVIGSRLSYKFGDPQRGDIAIFIYPDDEAALVDVRSFGVRMPPSTKENPNYGVMGLVQVVPPALAWLWRLVAPRGFKNPSIEDNAKSNVMTSEGVGSYWPFATGKKITQANMLLKQITEASETLYVLIPNQHIGVYRIGFAGEWIAREYLARRGGVVKKKQLVPARCPLFGYSLDEMKIDGQTIRRKFLRPELQSKLGEEGYDKGAKIITDFFKEELKQFLVPELNPLGREIIELCMNDAPLEAYLELTPIKRVTGR